MIIISIGRNPSNKIVIHDPSNKVSDNHGEIRIMDNGSIYYCDHSRNGTMVNSKVIRNSEQLVHRGTPIVFPNKSQLNWDQVPIPSRLPNVKMELTIGKNPDNRIQLSGDRISRYHAILKVTNDGKYYIYDQSMNGTSVNGIKIPSFTDYQVNRKDVVAFANSQQLDWHQVPGKGVKPMAYILPIAAVLVGVILYLGFNNNWGSKVDVTEKYSKSVCLVYSSFYLAYLDGQDTLYYIGEDGIVNAKTEKYKLNSLTPFEVTGTGFFINETGDIVTNKHVVSPWESALAIDKEQIQKELGAYNLIDQLISGNFTSSVVFNPKVTGISVKIGVFTNNSEINVDNPFDKNSFVECKLRKIDKRDEIDLALIQTSQKTLPHGAEYIKKSDIITHKDQINVDDEVTIIGFPLGLGLAVRNTDNIIKSSSNHGRISKVANDYEIQYDAGTFQGASGSPVFNKKGQLIAVNYSGMLNVSQGFNFGIIATYINDIR